MNAKKLSTKTEEIEYLSGKITPKKSDLYNNFQSNEKIENSFVCLSKKAHLLKKKQVLCDWSLENKIYYNNEESSKIKPQKEVVVSQCETTIEETA